MNSPLSALHDLVARLSYLCCYVNVCVCNGIYRFSQRAVIQKKDEEETNSRG